LKEGSGPFGSTRKNDDCCGWNEICFFFGLDFLVLFFETSEQIWCFVLVLVGRMGFWRKRGEGMMKFVALVLVVFFCARGKKKRMEL